MNKKSLIFLLASLCCFVLVFFVALMIGQYTITSSDFFRAIFTNDESLAMQRSIIINLRLPRTIMAALTGVGLALSGLLYQEVFQNKLTSPDLLGVSSGASVGAAIAILLGLSSALVSFFAFIFGVCTVLLTILVAKLFKNGHSITLILAGIIVGGFMSAALSMIKYFSDPTTTLATITYWLMGSFENATMKQVYTMLPIVTVSTTILLALSWRVNIVALGKEEAQTKGINYLFYKILLLGIATLLTAAGVAFNGTISWIGLVVPHLVRLVSGRDTRRSIPLTITFGSVFMIITDILARTFTAQEMPLSAITGLFGTVIFVVILTAKKSNLNAN